MPATSETLDEVRPEDIVAEDVFPDEDDDVDDPEENADAEDHVAEAAAETVQAETTVAPTTYVHEPELVEKAMSALFTADEISRMSPEVLRISIAGANRVGQAIYDANRKPESKEKTEEVADELAVLDDPALYDQNVVQPIKSAFRKQAERLEKLEKENEVLRNKTGQSEAQSLHSRLMGIATESTPEIVKNFDTSTQAGKQKYAELLTIMGGVWNANKGMPEKQIYQRAVKAMDLVPEKPKDSPAIAQKKKDWDDAAQAEPARTRHRSESAVEAVGKILAARRLADKARKSADKATVNGKKPH